MDLHPEEPSDLGPVRPGCRLTASLPPLVGRPAGCWSTDGRGAGKTTSPRRSPASRRAAWCTPTTSAGSTPAFGWATSCGR